MFGALPWPLAFALVLSYLGMTIIVTVAVNVSRWTTRATRQMLIAGIGVGFASVALRTLYFLAV